MRLRTMERRIILFLVFKAFMQSIHGQSPSLNIDDPSPEEGSTFTLNCSVAITDAIIFKLDNVGQGSCGAPFLGVPGTCTPAIITQSLADALTSWTISPALIAHRGSWKCTQGVTDSNVVTLAIHKLPVAVLTQSGISSNTTVNDTSSYPISIEVDCLFSENDPTVELEFVALGSTDASASMSCSTSSTTCSSCIGCSAYSCSHNISQTQALSSGHIRIGISYTLQIKVGVTGTTQTFSSAVFATHSIKFEGTSPTSKISTVFSIERSTAVKMYSSINVTTPMSTTGSLITQDSSTNTVMPLTILPSHVVETYIATLSNLFLVQTVSTDITDNVYEITNTSRVSRFSLSTETGKTLTTISHVDSSAVRTVLNSGRSERLLSSLSMNDNFNQQIVTTTQSPLMPTSSSFDISLYSSNTLDPYFSPYRHSSETIVTLPKNIVSNTLRSSLFDTMEHFINTKTILITSNVVDTNIPLNYLTNVYQTISPEFTASYSTSLKDSFQAIDHSLSLQTSAAIRSELTSSSCSVSLTFDDPVITSVSSGIFKSISTVSTITKSGISEKTKNVLFIGTLSALVTFIIVVLLTLVFVRIYLSKDNVKPQKKYDDMSWSDKSRSPMTAFPDYSFTGGNIHTRLNTSSTSFKMYSYENNWNDIV